MTCRAGFFTIEFMPGWEKRVEDEAERLDRWLGRHLPGYSLRRVQELIRSGRVRVQGRTAKKGIRVQPGELVQVEGVEPDAPVVLPLPGPELEVVFEDETLAVVDKPAGVPCHPLAPGETGTLLNAAVARWPELARVGIKPLELGLVHRLDTKTSGLVLLAKTEASRRFLSAELKQGRLRKIYRAVVHGRVKPARGEVGVPLGHHPKDKRRMVLALPGQRLRGRPLLALTRFQVVQRATERTLLELELVTGVTHQLRVHLAGLGHPIIGDDLYGPRPEPDSRRYLLQSFRMEFRHPKTQKLLCLEARRALGLDD